MTRAFTHGVPSPATGEVGEHRDGDDIAGPNLARIRRLYDTALARSAVGGDRSLQRYLAVLIAAPRST
jgi:hypothetical protein